MKPFGHTSAVWALALILASLSILLLHGPAHAATFCVSSAGGLTSALSAAGNNGQEDVIQVVQGPYKGEFVYASTETHSLTIEGGYVAGCTSRVVDPANTVLDGTGETLFLKSISPDQAVDFVVEGLTLQGNGDLYASTKGNVTVTNNTVRYGIRVTDTTATTVTLTNNTITGGGVRVPDATTITLTNNTITGGRGVFVGATTATLTNNTISGNTASSNGGGVFVGATTVTLTNNTISGNSAIYGGSLSAIYGGGIFVGGTTVTLTNNTITDNSVSGCPRYGAGGGGIYVSSATTLTLTNNTISGNSVDRHPVGFALGGGVGLTLSSDSDSADIYNNIIWNNSIIGCNNPDGKSDLYLNNDGDGNSSPSTVNLFNNDFDQSAEGIFITLPFVIDPSNLDNLDPLFVDATNGDYHLQAGSPVTNMGNNDAPGIPDTDKDGNLRIADGVVDMGAFEFGAEPAFILNVSKAGAGSGTVTSSPSGVNCGSDCSGAYSFGTVVTLTAATDPGSTFEGWSGNCSGTGPCVVSMTANRSVTATFSAGPMLSVSPTSLNFGEVEVNSTKDLTFTVTNSGGETLTGSVTTSSPFSVVSGSTFSLTAKTSQTVTVRFSPTTIDTFVGQVSISSNGGDATVAVTGTGVNIPVLSVTPTTLDFGEVQVGSSSDFTFTVTNTGTGTLSGTTTTLVPFSIVSGGAFSLGAGKSQVVTVRFSPTTASTFLGDVNISSNGGSARVSLSGKGVSCTYSISPTSQSFSSSGGTGSVSVTAPSGCSWTAVSNASWITITSGSSGSGNGTVSYSVAANTGTTLRTGTLTLAGQTFTVQQNGSCLYSGTIVRVTTTPGDSPSMIYFRTSALSPVFFSGVTSDAKLLNAALHALPRQTRVVIAGTAASCPAATAGGHIGTINFLIVNP